MYHKLKSKVSLNADRGKAPNSFLPPPDLFLFLNQTHRHTEAQSCYVHVTTSKDNSILNLAHH